MDAITYHDKALACIRDRIAALEQAVLSGQAVSLEQYRGMTMAREELRGVESELKTLFKNVSAEDDE